jgi:hypothetical protein
MSAFLLLLPGDWQAADEHLCRPLLGSRADRPPLLPWVVVAERDAAGRASLVPREGLDADRARALVTMAEGRAARRTVRWQVTRRSGLVMFRHPTQLRATLPEVTGTGPTDDLSAEQVLHAEALREGGTLLRRQELVAVLPRRGWLLLGPGRPGEFPAINKANELATELYARAGSDRICPYPVFVRDGELTGVNVLEGARASLYLAEVDPAGWLP